MQVTQGEDDRLLAADLDALVSWVSRNTPSSMSYTALRTLSRLNRDGELRITELAGAEHVSQPAMTALVNRLEADGSAQRKPDPDDGRASRVQITAHGRDLLASTRAARAELITQLLSGLTDAQRSGLAEALVALRPALANTTPTTRKAGRR